jgi:hypothetical protein
MKIVDFIELAGCVNRLNTVKIIYTMKLEPYRIFFSIALLYLIGLAWVTTPWMALGFFYAGLAGWMWNQAPLWFQTPLPKPSELLPIVMLLLFILVLSGTPVRSTSEALVYTAAALILFRGIIFLLVRIRNSKKAVPMIVKMTIFAFLFELVLNAIRVYSTFRFVSPSTLSVVGSLSIRGMMLILMLGWAFDQNLSKRERTQGWMFAVGAIGNLYLAGGMLIANTIFFLRKRKFTYEADPVDQT